MSIIPIIDTYYYTKRRYMYSSRNDNGHFGITKVIFGDSGVFNPLIDIEGNYGMTQHAMAIEVDDLEEAKNICL